MVFSRKMEKPVYRTQSKLRAKQRLAKLNANAPTDPNELIPTDEVKRHIAVLQEYGVGIKRIAKRAGVAQSCLNRIISGDIKRTRRSNAAKLFAVTISDVSDGARTRVDASLVLIGRLVDHGYRKGWIAQQLGAKNPALQIGRATPFITIKHARAIHDLYLRIRKRDRRLPAINPHFHPGEMESTFDRGGRKPKYVQKVDKKVRHGMESTYQKGCRCVICANAHRAFEEAASQHIRLRYSATQDPFHRWRVMDLISGQIVLRTSSRSKAYAVRNALNRRDPRSAGRMLVSAKPVRARLRELRDAGVTLVTIAQVCDTDPSYLSQIGTGYVKRVRRAIADGVQSMDTTAATPTSHVDASRAWEMVDRLLTAGFELEWLETLLDLPKDALLKRKPRMQLRRIRNIMALYAELYERVATLRDLSHHAA